MKAFSEELVSTAKSADLWLLGPPWPAEIFVAVLTAVIWQTMVPKPLRVRPFYWVMSAVIATLAVAIGANAGVAVGFAVMFGPSFATGDFIGLPWLTMLPGVALGGLAGFVSLGLVLMLGNWLLSKLAASDFVEPLRTFKLDPDE